MRSPDGDEPPPWRLVGLGYVPLDRFLEPSEQAGCLLITAVDLFPGIVVILREDHVADEHSRRNERARYRPFELTGEVPNQLDPMHHGRREEWDSDPLPPFLEHGEHLAGSLRGGEQAKRVWAPCR